MTDEPVQYRAEGLAWRDDVEAAIADAKSAAIGRGARVHVRRPDGEVIATAWPNGRVDLSFEGSNVA
jgi:hypothetical protein